VPKTLQQLSDWQHYSKTTIYSETKLLKYYANKQIW